MYVRPQGDEMDPLNPTEIVMPPDATETTVVVTQNMDVFELVYQGPDVNDGTMNAKDFGGGLSGIDTLFYCRCVRKKSW
jgi:hypothetical protein